MTEWRCWKCGKLLLKYDLFAHGRLQMVCSRPQCKALNTLDGLKVIDIGEVPVVTSN